jgi:DNA repair exonuclease SbcCD ATPase subunit
MPYAPCPFGSDCPNAACALELEEQLSRALGANEILRSAHEGAMARYASITERLTSETAVLADNHDAMQTGVESSKRALHNAINVQRLLETQLDEQERLNAALAADNARLTTTEDALTDRVTQLADALERLTARHEVALAKLRIFEQQAAEPAAVPRASSLLLHELRPMMEVVAALEQRHRHPRPVLAQPLPPTTAAAAPSASPPRTAAETRFDESAEIGSVARRSDALGDHAQRLLQYCSERPDLARLLRQLHDVERRNAELKTALSVTTDSIEADATVRAAMAKAHENFWDKKALEALDHAEQWRLLAVDVEAA